jgi:hypothetical protein
MLGLWMSTTAADVGCQSSELEEPEMSPNTYKIICQRVKQLEIPEKKRLPPVEMQQPKVYQPNTCTYKITNKNT